jgi:hypothetical protein
LSFPVSSFIIHLYASLIITLITNSVKDLRKIYKAMATKAFVRNGRWGVEGASNKKKADMIALIRKHFYDPFVPSSPNRQAMEELGELEFLTQPAAVQPAARSPAPLAAAAAPVRPGYPVPHMNAGYQYQHQQYGFHPHAHLYHQHPATSSPTAQAVLNPWMNRNQAAPASAPTTAPTTAPHTNTTVRVKLERHLSPDTDGPRNPMEMSLLVQLSQMGFTNRREILESIRELASNASPSQPPSVDSVMVAMITQREEAEEARNMDEARLQSEQARKEDAQRRRSLIYNNVEEKLKTASMDDWRRTNGMFPDSWILNENICYDSLSAVIQDKDTLLKCKLMALLKLEKKAKQWYGKVLPRGYFARCVTERLIQATAASMNGKLQNEVNALEVAMFQLSEQQGGVPRIFLEAHDDNTKEQDGDVQNGSSGALDSDDVVLVGTIAASPGTTEKAAGRSEPEVLEIL